MLTVDYPSVVRLRLYILSRTRSYRKSEPRQLNIIIRTHRTRDNVMLRGLGKFDHYHFVLSYFIVLSDSLVYRHYYCTVLHHIRVRYGFMILLKHIGHMNGNNIIL